MARSFSQVLRCAFFQEGTHALLLVVAVEQQLEGLALQRQGLVQRQVGAGQDHFLDLRQRQRRQAGDLASQFEGAINAWPSAATSLTNPMARASGARTVQPVNSMRSAWNLPTARTRRWVPPAPGITPTRTSGWAKRAEAPATIRSQCIANSQPPPKAWPSTAAISGLRQAASACQ